MDGVCRHEAKERNGEEERGETHFFSSLLHWSLAVSARQYPASFRGIYIAGPPVENSGYLEAGKPTVNLWSRMVRVPREAESERLGLASVILPCVSACTFVDCDILYIPIWILDYGVDTLVLVRLQRWCLTTGAWTDDTYK